MFKGLFNQGWRSSVAAGLCVAFAGGASAQSVEEFYKAVRFRW